MEKTSAAKLMYIKLPIYLFFYMALGLNDFDGGIMILMRANPFRGPYIKRLNFFLFCVQNSEPAEKLASVPEP